MNGRANAIPRTKNKFKSNPPTLIKINERNELINELNSATYKPQIFIAIKAKPVTTKKRTTKAAPISKYVSSILIIKVLKPFF